MITPNEALKFLDEQEEKARIAQEERTREKNAEALQLARSAEGQIDKLIVNLLQKELVRVDVAYPKIATIAGTYGKVGIQNLIYALNEIYQKHWEISQTERNNVAVIVFEAKPEPKGHWDSYCTECGRHHSAKYQEDLACPYCEGESTCLALPHCLARPSEDTCESYEMAEREASPSVFFYKAQAKDNRIVSGTTECESKDQLMRRLQAQGYLPLFIEKIKENENV